ncbi:DUF1566 domain-containing protein [Flavobacterium sp. H122]|uniref:DUF1566 domain-containing protein n=1 Tax=Flavobacterium sp. H122 TaxID=2529860 RepID=UPI0010A9E162|nr:DUF1566 domain-containing protein [Flavobacterium sp. H122]
MKTRICLLLSLIPLLFSGCQTEPLDVITKNNQIIEKDSELFDLINRTTTNTGDPLKDIDCIVFEYPIKINLYNSDRIITGSVDVDNEISFSAFLGSLPASQTISITYPLKTTLGDGSIQVINSNEDLKEAIEACEDVQIIGYYEGIFAPNEPDKKPVWRINYQTNANNKYVSGVFEAKKNKTLSFYYNGETLNGTWYFYRWNNETHLNISFEGNTQMAQDWRVDKKCTLNGLTLIIHDIDEKDVFLYRNWDITDHVLEIGDTGIGNGIVFYDKGHYSEGWRYLEVSREELGDFEWGCYGTEIPDASNINIGQGYINTSRIVSFHDNLNNYYTNPSICNSSNNGTVASQKATQYISTNDFTDWYLPSKEELLLIHNNLHLQSLGNFTNSKYWSSTQEDAFNAIAVDFTNGVETSISKIPAASDIKTRAIRSF